MQWSEFSISLNIENGIFRSVCNQNKDAVNNVFLVGEIWKYYCLENKVSENQLLTQIVFYLIIVKTVVANLQANIQNTNIK